MRQDTLDLAVEAERGEKGPRSQFLLYRFRSLFPSTHTFCPESRLARAVIAVLFHRMASLARGRAPTHRALVQHVPLGKPLFHAVSPDGVGMNVFVPLPHK